MTLAGFAVTSDGSSSCSRDGSTAKTYQLVIVLLISETESLLFISVSVEDGFLERIYQRKEVSSTLA
jgi:hypothetical protein